MIGIDRLNRRFQASEHFRLAVRQPLSGPKAKSLSSPDVSHTHITYPHNSIVATDKFPPTSISRKVRYGGA